MTRPTQFSDTERFESLKAAVVGGLSAGTIAATFLLADRMLATRGQTQMTLISLFHVPLGLITLTLLANIAVATFSGALCAITYRYAVRQDRNPQLKFGVVFAFTFVRGLAQVDAGSAIAQHFWPFFAACGESLAIFTAAAIALEVATHTGWVSVFGKDADS